MRPSSPHPRRPTATFAVLTEWRRVPVIEDAYRGWSDSFSLAEPRKLTSCKALIW